MGRMEESGNFSAAADHLHDAAWLIREYYPQFAEDVDKKASYCYRRSTNVLRGKTPAGNPLPEQGGPEGPQTYLGAYDS